MFCQNQQNILQLFHISIVKIKTDLFFLQYFQNCDSKQRFDGNYKYDESLAVMALDGETIAGKTFNKKATYNIVVIYKAGSKPLSP